MNESVELPRVDLVAEALGGEVVFASDEFFADAANLLKPGPAVWREGEYTDRGKWMDGWESRRRRAPGNDFCLIALGAPGGIERVRIHTTHFKGNQPEAFELHGLRAPKSAKGEELLRREDWFEVVPRAPLEPDADHELETVSGETATHVRLTIVPDGGVARLRLLGRVTRDWSEAAGGPEPIDLSGLVAGGLVVRSSDETFGEPQNMLLPAPSTYMGQGWETRRRRGPGHDWAIIRLARRGSIDALRLETDHYKGNFPDRASCDFCDLPGAPATALPDESDWRPLLEETPLRANDTHQWVGELASRGPATHVRLNIFPDGGVARFRVFGRPVDDA
ncbi:MAG: allantoicase [Gemmatimonadetes bacterium]|nr:allantoicase [Gemmatimonadota bacterium]